MMRPFQDAEPEPQALDAFEAMRAQMWWTAFCHGQAMLMPFNPKQLLPQDTIN